MFTRKNLKDLLQQLNDTELMKLREDVYNYEYAELTCSVFNVGAVIRLEKTLNDLPCDYQNLVADGNTVFLEIKEILNILGDKK